MSNIYSKSKRQFKISEENVIRSIPAYDIVIGKRKDNRGTQRECSSKTLKRRIV